MDRRIIIKPTDYFVYEDGSVDYSYNYEGQYKDGLKLNELPADDLLKTRDARWREVLRNPYPSNITKYFLAKDLAKAKGFDAAVSQKKQQSHEGSSREL